MTKSWCTLPLLVPGAGVVHYGTCRPDYRANNPLFCYRCRLVESKINITRDTSWSSQCEYEMSWAQLREVRVCVEREISGTHSPRVKARVNGGERYHLTCPSAPVYQWHTHNLTHGFPKHSVVVATKGTFCPHLPHWSATQYPGEAVCFLTHTACALARGPAHSLRFMNQVNENQP